MPKEIFDGKEVAVLDKIYFEQSTDRILPSSKSQLIQLLSILQRNAQMEILISGHTDNVGDEEMLMELSINRAAAVKDYLTRNGIEENRIRIQGWGHIKPITSNNTESQRRLNRRVEARIIKFK